MTRITTISWAIGALLLSGSAEAVTLGQVDDFQLDVSGWGGSVFISASNQTLAAVRVPGGPLGASDSFLQLESIGWHLASRNQTQWGGDFLAAGVTAVEFDANVFATSDPIALRIGIYGPGGFFSSSNATSITSGGWSHYVISLTESDLTYAPGSGPGGTLPPGTGVFADTLSAVTKFVVRHDSGPTPTANGFHPQHVTTTIGLDNIHAVPEPSAFLLAWLAIVSAIATGRQRNMRRR
jgi:hypothetical protein